MALTSKYLYLTLIAVATVQAFPAFPNNFGNFGSMQPMPEFGSTLKFGGMQQAQAQQNQQQSQGQSAATGDGSADEGQLSSAQTSNTNTSDAGTVSQGGSLGQCQGSACKLNGAAQVGNQGSFQNQGNSMGQMMFGLQGQGGSNGFPMFGQFSGNNNKALQSQFQSQFQTGGASIGSGSVDKGTVNSVQDTKAITNKDGSRVASTNLGQAAGTNAALSGAVQASGQGQTAGQVAGLSSSDQSHSLAGQSGDNIVGSQNQNASKAALQSQIQSQSQGSGASVGEANAAEGTAQNLLSSNVETNAGGTSVGSNAANSATGKGLRVSGAVSASGSQQSQGQNNLALSLLQGSGLMMRPGGRSNNYNSPLLPKPVPVGGPY